MSRTFYRRHLFLPRHPAGSMEAPVTSVSNMASRLQLPNRSSMEEAKLDIDTVHSLTDKEIVETGGRITSAFTGIIADSFGTCIGCFGNIGDVRPIDWTLGVYPAGVASNAKMGVWKFSRCTEMLEPGTLLGQQ